MTLYVIRTGAKELWREQCLWLFQSGDITEGTESPFYLVFFEIQ